MNAHDILILRALQHAQRKHLAVGGNPGDRATGAAPGSAAEASRGSSGSQGSGTSGGWQGGNSGAQGSGTSGGWQGGGGGGNVGAEHGGSGAGGASGPEADRDRQAGEAAGQTKASSGLGGNAQPTGSPAGGFRGASGSNTSSFGGTQPGAPTGVSPATTGWAGGFNSLMDSLRDAMAAAQAPTPSIQGPIGGMSFNGPVAPSAPAINTSSYPKTETPLKEMQENLEKQFNKTSGLGIGATPPTSSAKQITDRISPEPIQNAQTEFEKNQAAEIAAAAAAEPALTQGKPKTETERIPETPGKYQGTLGDEGSLADFGEPPQPTTGALGDWNQTKPDFPMGGTDITGDMPDFDVSRTAQPYSPQQALRSPVASPSDSQANMDVRSFDPMAAAARSPFGGNMQNQVTGPIDAAAKSPFSGNMQNQVTGPVVADRSPSLSGNMQGQVTGPTDEEITNAEDAAIKELNDTFDERLRNMQMPRTSTTQPGAYNPSRQIAEDAAASAADAAASAALDKSLKDSMAAAQARDYQENISGMSFNPSVPSAPSPMQAEYDASLAAPKSAIEAPKAATEKTIQPGDTLGGIARKNNVSVSDLMDANPQIKDPNKIVAGQKINVPSATKAQKAKGTKGVKATNQDFGPTVEQMKEYWDKATKVAKAINEPGLVGWIGRQIVNAEIARMNKAAEEKSQGYKGNWSNAPKAHKAGGGSAGNGNGGGHEDQRDKSGNAAHGSNGSDNSENSSDASGSSDATTSPVGDEYLHLLPDSPAYVPYSLPNYNASISNPGLVSPRIAQFNAMRPPEFNIAPSQYAPQQNQQQNNLTGNDAFANAMRLINSGTAY